jgi:hypothetical protein
MVLYYVEPYCTTLYFTVAHWTMLYRTDNAVYRTIPCCTVLYHAALYYTMLYLIPASLYYVVSYWTILLRIVPFCTIMYHAIPYCTVLYRFASCCIVLWHAVQYLCYITMISSLVLRTHWRHFWPVSSSSRFWETWPKEQSWTKPVNWKRKTIKLWCISITHIKMQLCFFKYLVAAWDPLLNWCRAGGGGERCRGFGPWTRLC